MNPTVDPSARNIDTHLATLDNVRPDGYVPLTDFDVLPDGKGVERDSREWAAKFFSALANPYTPGNRAKRTYHMHTSDTEDVLRHDYTAAGLELRVLETVEVTFVSVERGSEGLLALPQQDQTRRISDIARRVLAMEGTFLDVGLQDHPYRWQFLLPHELREGARFSTDFSKNIDRMWSFANRVDGGIRNGRLYFLLYKRHEPTDGRLIFLSGYRWFDGTAWNPYRNIKPRYRDDIPNSHR